jgi:hypothetical protein
MREKLKENQERRELQEQLLKQYGHIKCNGYDTEKGTRIKVYRSQTNGITQNKVELARNKKGRTAKRKNKNWRRLVHWLI